MKRKITLLLSLILILTVGFTVSAEEQEENISMPLKKYSYSGSKANFDIEVSQNVDNSSLYKRTNGTSVVFENTQWGIIGEAVISEKMENQHIIVKFTDNSDDKIEIEEDNSLLLFNANEEMIGVASNFELKDANGKSVNVIPKQLNNNEVYYIIEDEEAVYPLSGELSLYGVDDFSQWFSSGSWVNRENGICLSLAHTGWAYTGCPTGLITWSWNTVVNKFSSSSHWTNEQGMAEQYQCHVNFATTKNPWNLEPWRPAVGVFETIEKECNP